MIKFLVFIAQLAVSTVIAAAATKLLIPQLRKLKAGQSIREDGPQGHLAKAGTPTMGGLAMILAIVVTTVVFARDRQAFMMIAITLVYGLIGFLDDYIKVVKKHNLGLKAWQKSALQVIAAVAISVIRSRETTLVWVPFVSEKVSFAPGLYIAFVTFMLLAMTNSVNLTDGLDGLCSSVTTIVAVVFGLIALGFGMSSASVFLGAVAGACVGFLFFNHHPAKVFMGDTGSLALGGALSAAAIYTDLELLLPIMGIIYVAEAMSDIIQVFVFKTQHGRRFFRMAPLHHHYELGGWSEVKVVRVFSTVTAIACIIGAAVIELF